MSFLRDWFASCTTCVCGVCTRCAEMLSERSFYEAKLDGMTLAPTPIVELTEIPVEAISDEPDEDKDEPLKPTDSFFQPAPTNLVPQFEMKLFNKGKLESYNLIATQHSLAQQNVVVIDDLIIQNLGPAVEAGFGALAAGPTAKAEPFALAKSFLEFPLKYQDYLKQIREAARVSLDSKDDDEIGPQAFALDFDETIIKTIDNQWVFINFKSFRDFVERADLLEVPWHIVTARPEILEDGTPSPIRDIISKFLGDALGYTEEQQKALALRVHLTGVYQKVVKENVAAAKAIDEKSNQPPESLKPPSPAAMLRK